MSLGGSGNGNGNGAENGKGKAKAKDQDGLAGELWKEFVFDIPGFHDEVFWNCQCRFPDFRKRGSVQNEERKAS